jgi:hypothetical protein
VTTDGDACGCVARQLSFGDVIFQVVRRSELALMTCELMETALVMLQRPVGSRSIRIQ